MYKRSRSSHFRKQNTSLTWSKKTFKFLDGREHIHAYVNTAPSSKALILVPVRHAHSLTLTTTATWCDKSYERGNHLKYLICKIMILIMVEKFWIKKVRDHHKSHEVVKICITMCKQIMQYYCITCNCKEGNQLSAGFCIH